MIPHTTVTRLRGRSPQGSAPQASSSRTRLTAADEKTAKATRNLTPAQAALYKKAWG